MNNVIKVSTSCQIGCVRSNNEDMILVNGRFIRNDSYSTSLPFISKKTAEQAVAELKKNYPLAHLIKKKDN